MSRPADWLCSVCTEVLNATRKLTRDGEFSITPNGQSLEASKEAVQKRCRMCVEVWRYDSLTDPWMPLRFDLSIGDLSKVPAGPQTTWFMINIWQGDCFKVPLVMIQADGKSTYVLHREDTDSDPLFRSSISKVFPGFTCGIKHGLEKNIGHGPFVVRGLLDFTREVPELLNVQARVAALSTDRHWHD